MRAAVYLRISEDRTGEELGISRQREDAARLLEQRGWPPVGEYADNDTSAAGKKRRPGFEKLLTAVERGEVDAIVAWSLDRLTRNRRDQLRLVEACEPRKVTIALVRGADIDMSSPYGRAMADQMATWARLEIEQKGDRQRAAYEQAAKAGKPPGGPVPFGFQSDRVTHEPREAAALRKAYADLLAGATLASIARDWNAAGLHSGKLRTGRVDRGEPSRWSPETVRAVLLKPRNAGLRAYKGEIMGTGTWPAIVDEETWRAAVARISQRSHAQPPPGTHLLSGLALCGVCDAPVNAGTHRGDHHAYRCGRTLRHVARRGDWIDDYISDVIVERLSRPDAAELLVDHDRPDVGALRARAYMLRGRIEDLALEYAADDEGVLTASQLRTATAGLKTKLAAVEARMADAGRVDVLGSLINAENVEAAWRVMRREHRGRCRAVVDTLMTVRVLPVGRGARKFHPESVMVHWKV